MEFKHYSGEALKQNKAMFASMVSDRTTQFSSRLGWNVSVDGDGHEIDTFDTQDLDYVVAFQGNQHLASLRLHRPSGESFVKKYFGDHFPHCSWEPNYNWESSRLCTSPGLGGRGKYVLANLIHVAYEFLLLSGCRALRGLCFAPLLRIYSRLGFEPSTVVSSRLSKGLLRTDWSISHAQLQTLRYKLRAAGCDVPTL